MPEIKYTKLTVLFRDESPMFLAGDSPAYRRVTIDLTQEQMEALRLKRIATISGREIFESVSQCFLE